jgi:1,2-diacylglycerol 3-alpha-glucosyltransferase/glucuronosyltransferase
MCVPISESWSYAYLRHHHGRARRTLVATEHQRRDLVAHGFTNVVLWSRGVDADLFKPSGRDAVVARRPIWMYAGRVAVEKNLDAFLSLDLPGTKVVVGDGPAAPARGDAATPLLLYRSTTRPVGRRCVALLSWRRG